MSVKTAGAGIVGGWVAVASLILVGLAGAQSSQGDLSLRLEIEYHLEGGLKWLRGQQKESGAFGEEQRLDLTAFSVLALLGDPARPKSAEDAMKGCRFLLDRQNPDGSLGQGTDRIRTTSAALLAWLGSGDKSLEPAARRARGFLISQQTVAGGFGGMGPTQAALEGLYFAQSMLAPPFEEEANWAAARKCVEKRPLLEDGLGESAGLLAAFYAGIPPEDSRNQVALDWLGKNFAPEKMVGVKPEDLAYGQYIFAKALIASLVQDLSGTNWREKMALHLHNQHLLTGPWKTPEGVDPLETSVLAILTLEAIALQL